MQEFSKLLSDRKHGSVFIVSAFLNLLERNSIDIKKAVEMMEKAFPDMVLVKSICTILRAEVRSKTDISIIKKRFLASQEAVVDKAVSILKKYDSFVTISSSGDIYNLLARIAQQKSLNVVISIGDPMREGVFQAERLAKLGIKVSVVYDAALSCFVKEYDAVVMGADGVGKSFFVNKIGSFPLMLAANYYKKPAYIVANSLKYSDNISRTDSAIEKDADNICYKKFYFEKVPLMAKWIHQ